MNYFKPRKKTIVFTDKQKARIARGEVTKKFMKAEVKHRQEGAYCKAKLNRSGLWNPEAAKRCTLVVRRVGDPEPSPA